ncbi:MAG: tRNA epoxyqueuosine(34) reductase QueG [FCB group bacterium]|nr:tRNA epoxyqueuosine(34) reductase QueG [FCB group bacterium]
MNSTEKTAFIKNLAAEFGFAACGISRVEELTEEASRLEAWLKRNLHGQMNYLADHFDLAIDPRKLMPETKAVISLAHNYYPGDEQGDDDSFKLSIYARGRDYHNVIRKKLKNMTRDMRERLGEIAVRICVDSAPIMEKVWAARSGLGWIGKNGNLINARRGSYFFLAELLVDMEPDYDPPAFDHCGKCRACIDACPTEAIIEPYLIDSRRCISYLTIEHKGDLPANMAGTYRDWIFGCDICQQVCPFNRFSVLHREKAFAPHPDLLSMTRTEWLNLSLDHYREMFEGSAVGRTGYDGLMRNIRFADKK